jgi:hypothetical protein
MPFKIEITAKKFIDFLMNTGLLIAVLVGLSIIIVKVYNTYVPDKGSLLCIVNGEARSFNHVEYFQKSQTYNIVVPDGELLYPLQACIVKKDSI